MTAGTLTGDAPAAAGRPPLLTRPLLLRFISVIGSSVSFYLPLSVVPRYVASSGSGAAAGLAAGALLLATVVSELATPRLVARAGYRLSLTGGLVLLGIVGGVPALVCLPAGVWVSARWGYSPVFAATAAAALLAVGSVPGLPGRKEAGRHAGSVLGSLRNLGPARLAAVFAASTMAAGVLVTFVPLAVTARSAGVATAALFAQPAAAPVWASCRTRPSP